MNPDSPDLQVFRDVAARSIARLGWLQGVRERAAQSFAERGFPTTTEEDWRYTDLRATARQTLRLLTQRRPPRTTAECLPGHFLPADAGLVVTFVDGELQPGSLLPPHVAGLSIQLLSDAPPEARATLATRIAAPAACGSSPLVTLNTALLREGLLIDVAPGTELPVPLNVVFANSGSTVVQNRLLVRLGAGSKATIIEHHISNSGGVSNSVTDVICEGDSALAYLRLQAESSDGTHLSSQSFTMRNNSRADLLSLDLGARLARDDLCVDLGGQGATVHANGLFIADENRHIDNHTRIDHRARHTTSRELYRGVMDGQGRGVFNGKVIVHAGAAGTDAQLRNQNLLLSEAAEIDTKPELEIYTDDVRCSHGATTGQLDPAAIFYLRSRGMSPEQARRMLIVSFVREVIKFPLTGTLDAHVLGMLATRFPEVHEVAAAL